MSHLPGRTVVELDPAVEQRRRELREERERLKAEVTDERRRREEQLARTTSAVRRGRDSKALSEETENMRAQLQRAREEKQSLESEERARSTKAYSDVISGTKKGRDVGVPTRFCLGFFFCKPQTIPGGLCLYPCYFGVHVDAKLRTGAFF
jgi:hypothetical protein